MDDERDDNSGRLSTVSEFIRLIDRIVSRSGWLGAFLAFLAYVVIFFPNSEDKSRTYRMLVFGEGIPANGFRWVWVGVSLMLLLAQRHYYSRRIRQKDEEVKRIGKEKSDLQQRISQVELTKSDSDERGDL